MQYSIVNYKTVKEISDFRIDAECFLPEHLSIEEKLNRLGYKSIQDLSKSVINFGAYSLCNYIVFQESGVPFVVTEDIKNNIVDDPNLHFISEDIHKILYKSHLKKGQILLTMAGAYLGQAAVFNGDYEASSNQAIAKITLKDDSIDPYFISTFLNSNIGQSQIGRFRTGTGQPNLNLGLIQTIKIPTFNKDFQKIIRGIVLQGVYLYNNSKSLYSQAEQLLLSEFGILNTGQVATCPYAHAIRPNTFIKNFSDTKKSERFDAEYFQPKYEEIVEVVKKYEGKFDELGNLVKIKKSVEPGSEAYKESGVPFVRVSNISKFELSDNNQQFISEELYDDLKINQPKKGEILLSKDATPGIAFYLSDDPQKMIVSGGILRLNPNSQKILPEYLTLVLNSVIVQKQIERDSGGSIINHWRPDQVKATIIPILKKEKQEEIKNLIQKSFSDRILSKSLLEIAKRGVEMAIEKNEDEAGEWINGAVKKLQITL